MQSNLIPLTKLSPEEKAFLASPYGFAKHYLGLPIMDTPGRVKVGECRHDDALFYDIYQNDLQKQILNALDPAGAKVSARTANGAGKTTMIMPGSVLWFMTMHPRGKVVITSGVDRQVREQVFPALHACKARLEGWTFNDTQIDAPNGSHCVGFTTREGGHFEGWHGNKDEFYDLLQHDGPLMIVVDEAKSVKPQIFDAIERCTYQRLLVVSSCGAAMGKFYEIHNKLGAFFKNFQLTAGDCPHADHDKNRDLILQRGINDPLVMSKVFAEFMGSEADAIIQLAWISRCKEGKIHHVEGDSSYYCDFAAGGDENVFAKRKGNKATILHAWREKDTMRACGEFIRLFRKEGMTTDTVGDLVAGDNCGMGKVVIDRLHELGWMIQRDEANAAADNSSAYFNRSAETWFEGAKTIENGQIILDDDETLQAQLMSRKSKPRSDGRLQLESKEEMKARGVGSPDRADAILGAMRKPRSYQPIPFAGGKFGGHDTSLLERMMAERGVNESLHVQGACTE